MSDLHRELFWLYRGMHERCGLKSGKIREEVHIFNEFLIFLFFTIDICIIGVGFGQFSTIQHWHYCPKPLLQKFWVLWPKSDKPKGSPMPIPKMVFRPWCSNCQCLSMEMMDQEFHAWSNTLFFHLIPLQGRVRCRHGQMRIKIQKSRVSRVSLVMRGTWMCYRTNKRQWTSYMILFIIKITQPKYYMVNSIYLLTKNHRYVGNNDLQIK